MLSESAHLQVRRDPALSFEDAGEHTVKNIAEPVQAFRLLGEGETARPARKPASRRYAYMAAVAILVLAVGGGSWWLTREPPPEPMVTADGTPTDDPVLAMPTGPSIAVLPFDNMSGDPEQDYFADGIVEDVLTRLSRFSNLRVIGRNSSFQFRGEAIDVRQVGNELGARYILEGSVRRSLESVRVTAQLLDTADGGHIWADSYDRDLTAENLFQIQDDIAEGIVAALGGLYGAIERDAATKDLRSYECILLYYAFELENTAPVHAKARDCLEDSVRDDPDYADAKAALSILYTDENNISLNPRPDQYDALNRALEVAQQAVRLDPENAFAHFAMAYAHLGRGEMSKFHAAARKSVELNPNNPTALANAGAHMVFSGDMEGGEPLVNKAIALTPNLRPGWWDIAKALALYHRGEYEEAWTAYQNVNMPDFYFAHLWLVAINGQLGDRAAAKESLKELERVYPGFTIETFKEVAVPYHPSGDFLRHLEEGLRKGGLRDPITTPSRPVIAVLPFANMSGDPEQDYFADGITEDIITRLARFSDLAVIARNSTFQYKGENVDVRAVAEDLGATYVLEGSVRRAGDTIRVTVQVLDAADGTHLLVETYDRALTTTDLFAVQDEITTQVAATIADAWGILARADLAAARNKPPESLESYECVLRAAEYFGIEATPDRHLIVRGCAERATRRDPNYADGVEKGAIDRVSRHGEAYRGEGGFAILRDDEDDLSDQNGSSGRDKHENIAISARHGFPRGAGADQLAHQETQIVAGDVEQVSLVHVLAPAQPSPAHAAAIEGVGKGALDDLGAQLEGFLGHPR